MSISLVSFSIVQCSIFIADIIQRPEPSPTSGWTVSDQIALVSALAAVVSALAAIFALWPLLRQRVVERRIRRDFGAELYLPEVIRAATRYYVRADASSLDLSQELEEPSNRVPTRENLFTAVERFLDDESEYRHLFLLADSGMGKSAFVLNFYAHNKRRFALKRYRLVVIPLGYPKALEIIRSITTKRDTVIFLDAFDEDPLARDDYWSRLKILLEECSEFRRVLITCRTQFFPKDDAIPVSTGLIKLGPRNDEAHYQFWRLYIAPLSDAQVESYLRKRYRFWEKRKRKRARAIVQKIPLLTLRPMLLTHIPEIMAANVTVTYSWQLYELMTQAWYVRETYWWKDAKSIRMFSEELAVKLYLNYLQQKSDRIPRSELKDLVRKLSVAVDEWNATSRSLLHRDAQGNFKFAHRSIMEYLFIKRFLAGDKRCQNIQWTDQMRKFMVEILRTPRGFEGVAIWERYDLVGADFSDTDLRKVDLVGKNLRLANFSKADLREADCHGSIIAGTDFSMANLSSCDLSDVTVRFFLTKGEERMAPNFQGANLNSANLTQAVLYGANFDGANLSHACMVKANLRGTSLREAKLNGADFRGARLVEANLDFADLSDVRLNSSELGVVKTSICGSRFDHALGLSRDQIAACELDEKTELPNEFDDLKTQILRTQVYEEEYRQKLGRKMRWTEREPVARDSFPQDNVEPKTTWNLRD